MALGLWSLKRGAWEGQVPAQPCLFPAVVAQPGLSAWEGHAVELGDLLSMEEEFFNKAGFFLLLLKNADAWKSKPFVET